MSTQDALQEVLAAEHAAMFVLAALGGATSGSSEPLLRAALDDAFEAHRSSRDELRTRIRALGGQPIPAAAAYDLPSGLDRPVRVTAAALAVERRYAATCAEAVAETSGDDRARVVAALDEAAVRELSFGGKPVAFPGLDELADR